MITVDLFCGAGGAAEGVRQAIESLGGTTHRGYAFNHWEVAIQTMEKNHPNLDSKPKSVEDVIPSEVVPGGVVDLLWASPSCTHFSKAKGGVPLSNQLRSQPELILTWLDQLFVRRVIVENVPQIVSWGPLGRNRRPLKSARGACFHAWIEAIKARNYNVDWQILNCANYGDATTRQRFFLQAVRKGCGKINWPDPTHSKTGGADLLSSYEKWRGVDTCLDWGDLGTPLSARKRPLVPNTMRRIEEGVRRFYGKQFVVDFFKNGRPFDPGQPMRTQTTKERFAFLTPLVMGKQSNPAVVSIDQPMMTVTASGRAVLLTPLVLGQQSGAVARQITSPSPTISTAGAISCSTPIVSDGRIVDCLFRMLKPDELAKAHSFPDDYVLAGNQGDQVKQIGNSVPVATARAIAAATLRTA